MLLYISDRKKQAVQYIEEQEEKVKGIEEVENINKLKEKQEVYRLNSKLIN